MRRGGMGSCQLCIGHIFRVDVCACVCVSLLSCECVWLCESESLRCVCVSLLSCECVWLCEYESFMFCVH